MRAATARHAHHEAGHAVAAVAAGGELVEVFLGSADWSTEDDGADSLGGTVHRTADEALPFVTFAGPWAEAMWTVEHDSDVDNFRDALEYAWDNNSGDTNKYESRVVALDGFAASLGFGAVGRSWESEWCDELESLWPVIRQVAGLLVDGVDVDHAVVATLLTPMAGA
jgi:hypothetical protein